ncbi:MAG: M1 family metallopeptidase [Luteibacter sp.]|uniref:M1 family metallopeptidase n=1 Tax=Luteibacter sp. TaxID=1886636 RepID=UPI0028096724|nr:M1 family metallopeptidase [Luteibacter sp.]MDQ7995909.1 M1 family metallopeptidase [Luteibacter sp.]MDQ8050590.1 M1 family metallopeptidase [Luteibacter sp.]
MVRFVAAGLLLCVGSVWGQAVAPALPAPAEASTVAPPVVPVEIPFASPHAGSVRTPSAPDAWGGPRNGQEATLSDRVVSYRIQARLDPDKHTVDGQQQLTWHNRSDRPVSAVFLHMYLNAFEGEGSTFFTERALLAAAGGARGTAEVKKGEWGYIDLGNVEQDGAALKWSYVHPDGGPATDHTVIRVDLAQPVPAGGNVTLDMNFHSQLPRVIERTGYVGRFHLVAQWFPKIGVLELPGERGATEPRWNVHEFHFSSEFYADFAEYDVRMTVPKGYVVGAVGEQQGEPVPEGNELTWHFIQGDVHDFAWMAAPGYKTLDSDWTGPGSPKVRVRVIYPPEYAASAKPVLKATLDSLSYFSDTLGPYPYKTVTAVVPPFNASEAGGMEYPTFFTAEAYDSVKPKTMDEYMLDFVTIHEFGHGYFYGLLASNEFEEPMLDEGLNEYWDERMLRERGQPLYLTQPVWQFFGVQPAMPVFMLERMFATLSRPSDPLGQNAWDRLSSGDYVTVYTRTATAMHDLEERLGKEVMEKAFKDYYARWHFRHPSIADLQASLSESSGKPDVVAQVFNQYVFGTDRIDDRVSDITSDEVLPLAGTVMKDGRRVETSSEENEAAIDKQREAWNKAHPDAKKGTGPFPWKTVVTVWRDGSSVPQTLKVSFADGSTETVRWDDQRRWARFAFTKPAKGVSAELDPTQKIYLDANKLNDSRTVELNHAASNRWGADFAALIQGIYAFLGTL